MEVTRWAIEAVTDHKTILDADCRGPLHLLAEFTLFDSESYSYKYSLKDHAIHTRQQQRG